MGTGDNRGKTKNAKFSDQQNEPSISITAVVHSTNFVSSVCSHSKWVWSRLRGNLFLQNLKTQSLISNILKERIFCTILPTFVICGAMPHRIEFNFFIYLTKVVICHLVSGTLDLIMCIHADHTKYLTNFLSFFVYFVSVLSLFVISNRAIRQ